MLPCMAHHKFKSSLGSMVSSKADRAAQIKGEMVESPSPYMFPRRTINAAGAVVD